jgi:hypothetical protein
VERRAVAAKEFLHQLRDRVGRIHVQTFVPISGEENVVVAEFGTRVNVRGALQQRKNGFVSILHNGIEYTIQWSAEAEYEEQVRQIVASFSFTSRISKTMP